MAGTKQEEYFHPQLKHSDRRFQLKKQLPADFHCEKCKHRLAKGEDFYFSTEAGAAVVDGGIHTAVWLNIPIEKNTSGESRAISDSDGKLLFKQASDFLLLSSKGRAQEVLCPCGTFVGTVSWDKAPGLLKPGWRVKLRYAVFRKGHVTAFDNCTQVMLLKPHCNRREVDDWLRELRPFVPSLPALRVEKQWPETIWEDAETLYSGWLHGQTWDVDGLNDAFTDLKAVEKLRRMAKEKPAGYLQYMSDLLGVLGRLALEEEAAQKRQELAERIFGHLKSELDKRVNAKLYMNMLHIFLRDHGHAESLYFEALDTGVADEDLYNFYLSLCVKGDFNEALAVVEGSRLFRKPETVPAYTGTVPMPPSTLQNLLKICRYQSDGQSAGLEGVVNLLSSDRVQTESLDVKETGHLSRLFEELFRSHREFKQRRDDLSTLRKKLLPQPSTKALIEEARYLLFLDKLPDAQARIADAREQLLRLGTEDPDVIPAVDVLCALEMGAQDLRQLRTRSNQSWSSMNKLWELVKHVFPAPNEIPTVKADPGHWNWDGDVPLPKRKQVEFGAIWILALVKQLETLLTELRRKDEIEIVTGRGAHTAGGAKKGKKPTCRGVLELFLNALVKPNGNVVEATSYEGGSNAGALTVTGLCQALYDERSGTWNLNQVMTAAGTALSRNAIKPNSKASPPLYSRRKYDRHHSYQSPQQSPANEGDSQGSSSNNWRRASKS